MPQQNNILLELHVPEFGKVKDYYGKLGFIPVWEREPEEDKGYLIMKMGNNILCFYCGDEHVYKHTYFGRFPQNTKRGYAVEIIIMVEDIESYYEKVKGFSNVVEELVMRPWGLKDFRVEDPFGFYLRFTSLHDILDDSNAVG